MVLVWPDGNELPDGNADLLDVVLSHSGLAAAAEDFLGRSDVVKRSQRSLNVLQGESARVRLHGESACGHARLFLGSEDATTCVIAVLLDREAGLAWAAHYDEGTCSDTGILEALQSMRAPHAYLVGAFVDSRGTSARVASALLATLHHSWRGCVVLQLACLGSVNTDPVTGQPRTRHLVVDCSTGTPAPACFEDRGPELPRRSAYQACRREASGLTPVWDTEACRLRLPAFDAAIPSWHAMYLERVARLTNVELLSQCSTSPEAERPCFVEDVRAGHAWLLAAQEDASVPEAEYEWDYGGWRQVHVGESAPPVRPLA
ncbi:hypothetical protein FOA52_011682 [Chlamydomonas sp. UWO 241]|nr:hypothetical protein FOA52_011682 [Chlamydomonas sp. UWO 241]